MINHTLKYACMGIFPSPVRKSKDTCACDVYLVDASLIQGDNMICPNVNTVIVNQVYSKCRKSKYVVVHLRI